MHLRYLSLLGCLLFSQSVFTADTPLQIFTENSYQQILNTHQNTPFVMIIWSINCPSCLAEMQLLSDTHERYPALKILMVSTDAQSAREQIQMYLEQYQLTDIENWLFKAQDSERLRQSIDTAWQGEVPRSYFFTASGTRNAVSGLLNKDDLQKLVPAIID